jgi:hypothetical protein
MGTALSGRRYSIGTITDARLTVKQLAITGHSDRPASHGMRSGAEGA